MATPTPMTTGTGGTAMADALARNYAVLTPPERFTLTVEAMAREQGGVCGLRLYVEAHNETAQATYRRCGMSETVYRMFEVAR